MWKYYCDCVSWPVREVRWLIDMVDAAREITYRTFASRVDRHSLRLVSNALGYPRCRLTLASDRYVTYHRSVLRGERAYYLRHSAIEYVFCKEARS